MKGGDNMASKENEKYEVSGTASVGESITLTVNTTTVYEETVPAWATSATIFFRVVFD